MGMQNEKWRAKYGSLWYTGNNISVFIRLAISILASVCVYMYTYNIYFFLDKIYVALLYSDLYYYF